MLSNACLALSCLLTVHAVSADQLLNVIADNNAKFSRDFVKSLQDVEGNLVTSPFSAHMALAITYLGARGNTASDMRLGLSFPSSRNAFKELLDALKAENREGTVSLKLANRMFINSALSVDPSYIEQSQQEFDAAPQSLSFSSPSTAREVINQWVQQVTDNKVNDLMKEGAISASDVVVLVNALYLHGQWEQVFNRVATRPQDFHVTDDKTVRLNFMKKTLTLPYNNLTSLDAQLIQLPIVGGKLSMVILLPNSRTGVRSLERSMQDQDLSALIRAAVPTRIKLALPRFKIETTLDLKTVITNLGLGSILSDSADFSGISPNTKITSALQKTVIQVAEEGVKVASAAAISIGRGSGLDTVHSVSVEHPFLFCIVHRTTPENHVVLFNGRVIEPEHL